MALHAHMFGWNVVVHRGDTPNPENLEEKLHAWSLEFTEVGTGNIMVFSFLDNVREYLVKELTGGVTPATASDLRIITGGRTP